MCMLCFVIINSVLFHVLCYLDFYTWTFFERIIWRWAPGDEPLEMSPGDEPLEMSPGDEPLEMSPKRITINGNYIAIFSASERTSCALGICNSEWVTVPLTQLVLNIHRGGYNAFSWCHVTWLECDDSSWVGLHGSWVGDMVDEWVIRILSGVTRLLSGWHGWWVGLHGCVGWHENEIARLLSVVTWLLNGVTRLPRRVTWLLRRVTWLLSGVSRLPKWVTWLLRRLSWLLHRTAWPNDSAKERQL